MLSYTIILDVINAEIAMTLEKRQNQLSMRSSS